MKCGDSNDVKSVHGIRKLSQKFLSRGDVVVCCHHKQCFVVLLSSRWNRKDATTSTSFLVIVKREREDVKEEIGSEP
jgi:hypothetical protein